MFRWIESDRRADEERPVAGLRTGDTYGDRREVLAVAGDRLDVLIARRHPLSTPAVRVSHRTGGAQLGVRGEWVTDKFGVEDVEIDLAASVELSLGAQRFN